MRNFWPLIAAYACLTYTAWPQAISTSQIKGTVQDPSGLAVPGAEVRAIQTDTGATRTAVSSADGGYILPDLPVGPYRLEASKQGFSTYIQSGIVLQIASNPTIDIPLKVGTVTEQVQVQADASMVETQSTGVGQVIDAQRVVDLPLVGRQVADLITLAGGATYGGDGALLSARNYPNLQSFSVSGGLAYGTAYVLDGALFNGQYTAGPISLPFPDALQEFKVETSALPAQYGMHSSAVNAVTKSGSNEFHGMGFEFVRNYRFDARNYFSPTLDSLKRNQYGGTFGGPIRKNKLFFFVAYQETDTRQSPNGTVTFVPTAAEEAGNFTVETSSACQAKPVTLKNPANGNQPFQNNQIPISMISAPALAIAAKLPTSNDPCGRTTYGAIVTDDEHFGVARADYQINSNHSVFVRYLATHDAEPVPYALSGGNLLTTSSAGYNDFDQALAFGDTYLIGANVVNSFRATFVRTADSKAGASFFSPQSVGINLYNYGLNNTYINVTGGFALGTGGANANFRTTTIQLGDDVSWVKGKHQLMFGASVAGWDSNTNGNQYDPGQMTFTGQATGLGIADFFTGNLSTLLQAAPNTLWDRSKYFGLYAQDSWKVKSNLTVNIGLRWEPYLPPVVAYVEHFTFPAYEAGITTTQFQNAPPGLTFPGDPGFPKPGAKYWGSGMNNQWNQYEPRIGLAWDPKGDGKMSVRAGVGIYYDQYGAEEFLNDTTDPPYGASTQLTSPAGGLANPWLGFPGGNPFPFTINPSNPSFTAYGGYVTSDFNTQLTSTQQWNTSIQRQFGNDWLASISYLGNHMIHLYNSQEINPGVYVPGTCSAGQYGLTAAGACSTTTNINQRRVTSMLNPTEGVYFGDINTLNQGGTGSYNGLILSVQRRYSHGVTFSANYAWSHCIANPVFNQWGKDTYQILIFPTDRAIERGNCNTSASDRRQVANMTAIGEMPAFSSRWMTRIVSGWRASGTVTMQSGAWLTITSGLDNALAGYSNERPNQVAQDVYGNGTVKEWLNPASFAQPALGTLGNLGPGAVEGPGLLIFNAGVSRLFRVKERHVVEARFEAQNAINHANFGSPTLVLSSSTFGQITSTVSGTAGNARVMQFALKYSF